MAIFVIFNITNPDAIAGAMANAFPQDHLQIRNDQYLVSAFMTAKDVSDRLMISEGDNGNGIVFRMESYFGRTPVTIWDWVKTKAEQPSGQQIAR